MTVDIHHTTTETIRFAEPIDSGAFGALILELRVTKHPMLTNGYHVELEVGQGQTPGDPHTPATETHTFTAVSYRKDQPAIEDPAR